MDRLLRVVLVLAVAAGGCSLVSSSDLVDGWAVGAQRLDCTDRAGDETCGPYIGPWLASVGGAPAGTTVTVHDEGVYPGNNLVTRSLSISVVVVTSPDGSRRAVGVACGPMDTDEPGRCTEVPPPES